MERKFVIAILAVGILTSVLWGVYRFQDLTRRTIVNQLLADTYRSGSDGHVGTAINLLIEGSFYGTKGNPFFGLVPRSQIYSLCVAAAFVLFGFSMWSVYLMNLLWFLGSLILLYAISSRFLERRLAAVPPFMLALFWGAFEYVWIINTETLTLFVALLFIYGFMRYRETEKLWHLIFSALGLATLVVNKSIMQYFIPVVFVLVLRALRQNFYPAKLWRHWLVFFGLVLSIVGGFMLRNYAVLGSTDFSRGGHALLIHSKTAEFRGEKLKGFILSQFLGDFITDKILPGYAAEPEPLSAQRRVGQRWREMRFQNVPELETDRMFWGEAKEIIKARPLQFLSVAPWWFLRLNGPVHYNLATIDHVFVGTHKNIPDAVKVAILLMTYVAWFSFIAIVILVFLKELWAALRTNQFSSMIWVVALVLYFNVMYSVFTHAEVRYILPVMPLYFLFFALFLKEVWTRKIKMYNIVAP